MSSNETVSGSGSVDTLVSVHAIQQLAYRYARAHDGRDLDELLSLFAPADDALLFPRFNRASLAATMPEYFAVAGPTILFVANHIIEFDGRDRATGSVYCFAKLSIGGSWIEQAIQYQDVYEQASGNWVFTERRHLLWYGIELPERPFDQAKTQWPTEATGRGSLPEDLPSWRAFYGIPEAPTGFYSQPQAQSTFL